MNAIQEERLEEVRQLLGKEMDPTAKNFMVLRACADQSWVEIAEMIYNWTEPYLFGDPSKLALRGHDTKRQKLYAKQISNQKKTQPLCSSPSIPLKQYLGGKRIIWTSWRPEDVELPIESFDEEGLAAIIARREVISACLTSYSRKSSAF